MAGLAEERGVSEEGIPPMRGAAEDAGAENLS